MLDYQCVTEKAVASSRRRNSSRKADTRNFVCGRGSSHLRQSLAEPNDFISPFILPFISPFISPTLSICFTHISWQAIKSPDSLQLSIIMTGTLSVRKRFSMDKPLNSNNLSGKHGGFPDKSGNSRHCQCSDKCLIPICRKCT